MRDFLKNKVYSGKFKAKTGERVEREFFGLFFFFLFCLFFLILTRASQKQTVVVFDELSLCIFLNVDKGNMLDDPIYSKYHHASPYTL